MTEAQRVEMEGKEIIPQPGFNEAKYSFNASCLISNRHNLSHAALVSETRTEHISRIPQKINILAISQKMLPGRETGRIIFIVSSCVQWLYVEGLVSHTWRVSISQGRTSTAVSNLAGGIWKWSRTTAHLWASRGFQITCCQHQSLRWTKLAADWGCSP